MPGASCGSRSPAGRPPDLTPFAASMPSWPLSGPLDKVAPRTVARCRRGCAAGDRASAGQAARPPVARCLGRRHRRATRRPQHQHRVIHPGSRPPSPSERDPQPAQTRQVPGPDSCRTAVAFPEGPTPPGSASQINQDRASGPATKARGDAQNTRFWRALDGHLAACQGVPNGGSRSPWSHDVSPAQPLAPGGRGECLPGGADRPPGKAAASRCGFTGRRARCGQRQ